MPRRTDISSILVIGAGPIIVATAMLTGASAWAGTSITRTPVGRLTLVREHYVRDGTPVPHVASERRKNRLEWLSADKRVRLFLEDDGAELAPRYAVVDDRLPGREACFGEGDPQAYQTKGPSKRRWRSLQTEFERLLRYCVGWLDDAQSQSYLLEFASAADDFPAGLDLLKQAAIQDFGGWRRRCVKIKVKGGYSPSPAVKCVRYSARAN
jgi:hypothetical protein